MQSKIRNLADSYLPQWRFQVDDPDLGSVVAILYGQMLEDCENSLARVLDKHRLQFLNMLDPVLEEPIETAKSYVAFEPAGSLTEPVWVPLGTRLLAAARDGQRVVFETTRGVAVTSADVADIVETNCARDSIVRVFDRQDGGLLSDVRFTAFSAAGDSIAVHRIELGLGRLFDELRDIDLTLTLTGRDNAPVDAALLGTGVRWLLRGPGEDRAFDLVEPSGDTLRLRMQGANPQMVELADASCYAIACECLGGGFPALELASVGARLGDAVRAPDAVVCGGVEQPVELFLPFGGPMDIYAECGIESREVFSKRGAAVEMSFALDYRVIEQALPVVQVDTDYKVIMRRPHETPEAQAVDVHADSVLIEYLSTSGWKRLLWEEHVTLLFNGGTKGDVTLRFDCPHDMADADDFGAAYRMRMRLLRADNLYALPSRQLCPVIRDLKLAYSFAQRPQAPTAAVLRNNFETADVTDRLGDGRPTTLFYSREDKRPALYLGFDTSPAGGPVSLYLDVKNHADRPLDITMEYLRPSGFTALQMVDHTGGLLHAGVLELLIPTDIAPSERYGRERYWLRLLCHSDVGARYSLPVIRGVRRNMAAVHNVGTSTEYFYPDDTNDEVHIALLEQSLVSLRVFVNEGGDTGEHWVEWRRASHIAQQGRVYHADLLRGTVTFYKHAFAGLALPTGQALIRADYESYQGSAANVEAGAINTLSESIRHIAGASNPMPAFGGHDSRTQESLTQASAAFFTTRGRAVTERDYEAIVHGVSRGIGKVKCRMGVNLTGRREEDAVTIAVLLREHEQGGHIFSAVRHDIERTLLERSDIVPMGRALILSQPHFITLSVRLWMQCARMEQAFTLQKQAQACIDAFIDPLTGGFGGDGWDIGVLPTTPQLLAYLKMHCPDAAVRRIVVTAGYGGMEFVLDDDLVRHIDNPFVVAVSGEHVLYMELAD